MYGSEKVKESTDFDLFLTKGTENTRRFYLPAHAGT